MVLNIPQHFLMLCRFAAPPRLASRHSRLLAQHIRQQEPGVNIFGVFSWPFADVKAIGGWNAYLTPAKGWVQGDKIVFIFNDAQYSYEDPHLWGESFKNIGNFHNVLAIVFARYGRPTLLGMSSTPFSICDSQRVTSRPVDHNDGLGAVGLFFSRMEFDDLVRQRFSPSSEYWFHPSFFDGVFEVTGGHPGAIHSFVQSIVVYNVSFFMMSERIT